MILPETRVTLPNTNYQMVLDRFSAPVVFCIVYFWWIVTTPFNRFPIFTEIRFELLLVVGWSVCIYLQRNKGKIISPVTTLLFLLYVYLLITSVLSPYPNTSRAAQWLSGYWKKIVFFILLAMSIRNKHDFYKVLTGLAIVILLYQLHSWRDFLAGGSYVYQQGMKRMVAVWTAGGYGAGNYWGFLSVFAIPIIYYVYNASAQKYIRFTMIVFAPILCASVIFSGSRGSLITLVFCVLYIFRKSLLKPRIIIAGIISIFMLFPLLPEENRKRYTMIFISSEEIDTGTRTEQIAKESAASRVQGFIDGWNLLIMRPLGVGPGFSSYARRDVNPEIRDQPPLQLHNLYGQVLGETGIIGTLLVFLLWFKIYQITKINAGEVDKLSLEKSAVRVSCIVLLVYGMASHSLYDDYWIWLYAFSAALFNISLKEKNLVNTQSMSNSEKI